MTENKLDNVRSINESTTIIKTKIKMGKQIIWEIGQELQHVKEHKTYKDLNYNTFKEYVNNELEISGGYARKYISIYKNYDRFPENGFDKLGISKLYLLGQVDDPEERQKLAEKDLSKRELRKLIKMIDSSVNPALKEMVLNDEINSVEEFEEYKELFNKFNDIDFTGGDFDYSQLDAETAKHLRISGGLIEMHNRNMKLAMEKNILEIDKLFNENDNLTGEHKRDYLKDEGLIKVYDDYKENGEIDINILLDYILNKIDIEGVK